MISINNKTNHNQANSNQVSKKAIKKVAKHYLILRKDLPLSCPMPESESWSSHPKVYLPIEDKGDIKCPYCGARYVLEE